MTTVDGELCGRLRRVLEHELRMGLRNRAIMGGLQQHCPDWLASLVPADATGGLPRTVKATARAFAGYGGLAPAEREALLRRTLDLLDRLEQGETPALSPSSPTAPTVKQRRPTNASRGPSVHAEKATSPSPKSGILDAPVTVLPGIKAARATRLRNLGIETVRDLLYLMPRRYSEVKKIKDLLPGETQTVVGEVWRASRDVKRSGISITNLVVADNTGTVRASLFRAGNSRYWPEFKTGETVMLTGPVDLDMGFCRIKPTEIETGVEAGASKAGSLVPIYPLSGDLKQGWVRARVGDTVAIWARALPEHLPAWLRQQWQLLDLPGAVRQIHAPDGWPSVQLARRRLAFDELLLIQLGLLRRRESYQSGQIAPQIVAREGLLSQFIASLPFALTAAQQRVTEEIVADIGRSTPTMRLLQGDVGSGKTVVAAGALVVAVSAGFQGAIMAPTEILAGQHYRTIASLMERLGPVPRVDGAPRPVSVALLTGSQAKEERLRALAGVREGESDIVVGTHALIEGTVEFARLGVAVVDEQHRFGVTQRANLRQKGFNPHMLAMTATPIPRTLALTLYGDLDLSIIDEMPPGRQPALTRSLGPDERWRAYTFVRKRVQAGEQAFVVCPLIEESEKIEAKAATAEYERLQREVFAEFKLGLLHGKLKAADKEKVMQDFRANAVQILVSTSVVEVGVDVPNATVMLIEGADRFGLAQLHQFRGRVGRGGQKAYCVLVAESPSEEARQRLTALERTQNGFELAEEDLKLRGPGEFFGTRQSGLPDLRIAKVTDV
ncbi:MAG: ATP-dependent DNA helicase RecG, partial [Chloroflexota bacterium]